ncbi:MAG TPA: hypothetical protein VMM36_13015, partial [Opitutaceae bacterium]|nr:hypothetical protein [Opitutaceae bacterium]
MAWPDNSPGRGIPDHWLDLGCRRRVHSEPKEHSLIKLPFDSAGTLPPFLADILRALVVVGRPLLVGGCVRDWLMHRESKDYDIEVYDAPQSSVDQALARFGSVDAVGRSFGVIKFRRDEIDYDISLPRKERKTGTGHRGFEVEPDPSLSPFVALARRDFTINAMAIDPISGELIDPFGG